MIKFLFGAAVGVVVMSLFNAASYESRVEEIRMGMEEAYRNEDE